MDRKLWVSMLGALTLGAGSVCASVQTTGPPHDAAVVASIHRLLLTDGSYQVVARYQIKGNRVRYMSAERGGEWEEIPVSLVDWAATEKYAREHTAAGHAAADTQSEAAAIDKEEQQERAEQQSRTPAVQPGLRLPDQDGVWALDFFQDRPELVKLVQDSGDLNERTGHNMLRQAINPLAGKKQEVVIDGARAKVRLHEPEPALYISLTTGNDQPGPDALSVDTRGAGSQKGPAAESSPDSKYAIVRVMSVTRKNYRVVSSVNLSALGRVSQSEDIVGTKPEILPGKHWMKVVPAEPLLIGEYALVELPAPGEVNLSVWDFAIDPQAPENQDAILPLQRGR